MKRFGKPALTAILVGVILGLLIGGLPTVVRLKAENRQLKVEADNAKITTESYIHGTVEDSDDELFPCPFCGSEDVELVYEGTTGSYVKCNECSAKGGCRNPYKKNWTPNTSKGAIQSWNRAPRP